MCCQTQTLYGSPIETRTEGFVISFQLQAGLENPIPDSSPQQTVELFPTGEKAAADGSV